MVGVAASLRTGVAFQEKMYNPGSVDRNHATPRERWQRPKVFRATQRTEHTDFHRNALFHHSTESDATAVLSRPATVL